MDFSPETDFPTWTMLFKLALDESSEIEYLQNDFIRLLKYYIENNTLPSVISEFNSEYINVFIPDVIRHITTRRYYEHDANNKLYLFLLTYISKQLIQGLSKDNFDVNTGLDLLFNSNDPFFASSNQTGKLTDSYQFKKFCFDFSTNNGIDPLFERLKQENPHISHFFHFFRILSYLIYSLPFDTILFFLLSLKPHLLDFINGIDFTKESSANIDPNELLLIARTVILFVSTYAEFNDIILAFLQLSARCLKCESLNKQICGAKLLNTILKHIQNDSHSIIEEFIQNSDIYGVIVAKNYHESLLPYLTMAFDALSCVKRDVSTFPSILSKIFSKILHSHFTTKNLWIEMLFFGLINSDNDKEIIQSFLIDYLLNRDQTEFTIEIIEKLILELPDEFNEYTIQLLEFLLSLIDDQSIQNDEHNQDAALQTEKEIDQNEEKTENEETKSSENQRLESIQSDEKMPRENELADFALNSIKRIAIGTNVDVFRNLILEYCRKKLVTDGVSSIVIGILQFLIENSSISTTGINVNQIVDDNLIDTLLSALKSKEKDKESIFDLLTTCFSIISITPIQMNPKQISAIFPEIDSNGWNFFSILFEIRGIDFLEPESISVLQSYLDQEYDYSKCTPEFVIFLLNFILAIGTSDNKILRTKSQNKWNYSITQTDLIGIDFILKALYESTELDTTKHIMNIILHLISICKTHEKKGEMISLIFSHLTNPKHFLNTSIDWCPHIYTLFVRIIKKFEEGIGIEEFGYERHLPTDKYGNINITVDTKLKLNVSPYMTFRSLVSKIAFHLKSTEDSISISANGIPISNYDNMIALDIKDGSDIEVDKLTLVSCNYSIENVPTFIYMKNHIQETCLNLLRNEMAKETKESIWQLLKLMPSLKLEDQTELLKKVKDSINEYRLLYLLQISYIDQLDCSEIILEMILNQIEIIRKNPISPAFAILAQSSIKLNDYIDTLLELILNNLMDNFAVDSTIRLLTKICNEDNSKVTLFLLKIDYSLLSSDALNKLKSIFQSIQEKKDLFVHLSQYIPLIKNDVFCIPFFSLLSQLMTIEISEESVNNALNLSFDLLSNNSKEELLIYGVSYFLTIVFNTQPDLLSKYAVQLAELLVPRLFSNPNESLQKTIVCLLEKSKKNIDAKEKINQLLADHFAIEPNHWHYDPSKNIKVQAQQTGLKNLGATCYLNSILQQLYGNSEFRSYLSQCNFTESNLNPKILDYLVELQKLFVKMQLTDLPYLDTRDFCKKFNFIDNQPIDVRQQQDAIELYQFLIDKLPKNLKDLYEGQIVNTIEGINVDYQSKNYESFYNLCLTVKGFSNIEDSFNSFLTEEMFQDDNQYYADTIGTKIDARKYSRISKLPPHLVIQLKRFEYNLDTFMKYKVNDYFEFPYELDISKYTTEPQQKQIYELTGVVIHNGIADAGHYYSLLHINDIWYCFDDNEIYLYDQYFFHKYVYGQNTSKYPSAYLLFYTKKDNIKPYSISRVIHSPEKVSTNELSLLCNLSLRDEIDKENKMYLHMQSSFTLTILQYQSVIDDFKTLTLYVLNVLLHSNFETAQASELLIYLSKIIQNSDEFIEILCQNSKSVFDNFLYCQSEDKLLLFLKIIHLHLLKSSYLNENDNGSGILSIFVADAFQALKRSIFVTRAIPSISILLFVILQKRRGVQFGLDNNYVSFILDFLHLIINTNQPESFWASCNLKYLFEALIILKDGIKSTMLVNLMNNCNNFLLNEENSIPYIKLFMTCFEYDVFISHVFRLFDEVTIGIVIVNTFCCAENEQTIRKFMKLFLDQKIRKSDISFYLYQAISTISTKSNQSKGDIIDTLIQYPESLLFDFLICEDGVTYFYIEKIIYSLFSSQGQPSSTNPFIQHLLTTQCESLFSKRWSADAISICTNINHNHELSLFSSTFIDFLRNHLNSDKNEDLFERNKLNATVRIIRWMIYCLNKSNETDNPTTKNVINSLFELNTSLFNKALLINHQYNVTIYELLVNVLYILTINPSYSIDIKTAIMNLFMPNAFSLYPLYVSHLFLVSFAILLHMNNKDVIDTEEWKASFIEFLMKSPNETINDFSFLLSHEEHNPDVSHIILNVIESNMQQLIINNVFPIIQVVFSLLIDIPQKMFVDVFSFLIVFVEMNFEKTTNQSTNEINRLLRSSMKHLENQAQIPIELLMKHIPMFIDLYCNRNDALLRSTIRDFFGILCQKSDVLKDFLMEMVYQYQTLEFDLISFFLHIIQYETNNEIFSSFFTFLLSSIQICLKDSDDCEECFSELMLINNSKRIDAFIPKDSNHPIIEPIIDFDDPNFIWTSLVDISKFLLPIFKWKEKTQEFFLFVLKRMNENECMKLVAITCALVTKMFVYEGLSRAAFIVENRPEIRENVANALQITKESVNLWPASCKHLSNIFFE